MIQYALKCDQGHRFDSWFQSAAAFDKLQSAGMLACATCGSAKVGKELMAPSVRPARKAASTPEPLPTSAPEESTVTPANAMASGPLSAPRTPEETAIAEMRKAVEQNSNYVGENFAKQARDMHNGDTPETSIYGEASREDAVKLIEDGIPIVPLPFRPTGKAN
jgi:hypothetical protein